jgi:hypothetical protein
MLAGKLSWHTNRKALTTAIEALPDLAYPQQVVATGTTGVESDANCLGNVWAAETSCVDFGGQN